MTVKISLLVELRIDAREQLHIFTQLVRITVSHTCIELRIIETLDSHTLRDGLLRGCIEVETLFIEVIDTLKTLTNIDRPGHWSAIDMQFAFQFVDEVERILSLTVHLVDEDDDWSIAHTADLHQFARLALDTFGTVHNNDN